MIKRSAAELRGQGLLKRNVFLFHRHQYPPFCVILGAVITTVITIIITTGYYYYYSYCYYYTNNSNCDYYLSSLPAVFRAKFLRVYGFDSTRILPISSRRGSRLIKGGCSGNRV